MQEAFVIRGPKFRRCSNCRLSNDRVFVLPMLQLRVKDFVFRIAIRLTCFSQLPDQEPHQGSRDA